MATVDAEMIAWHAMVPPGYCIQEPLTFREYHKMQRRLQSTPCECATVVQACAEHFFRKVHIRGVLQNEHLEVFTEADNAARLPFGSPVDGKS